MITNINTILGWFKTGKKPTQKQFWDTWQSFWHKDEQIPQAKITDLTDALNAKTEKVQFEAHKIDKTAHAFLFEAKEDKNQKGIAGGYAPLNHFTKLASQYLDIVNDLISGGSASLLSAEQGMILQEQINTITILLTSDNSNLDTVQKIVDAIETIQATLSTILVNDLTSGGTAKALTAEMGKLLENKKVDKSPGKSLLADTEITRLGTLANYTHPVNHSPDIITQNPNNRFVTDDEKTTWNTKQPALGFIPENAANKNTVNGYAGLGADGKLLSSQLPALTINNTFVIASQAEMLALTVETGDIAVRTDLNKSFILKGTNPAVQSDWQELLTPTSDVTTVFGRNGAVTSQNGDYTANQITETAERKFQSATQQAFNDATSSIQTQLDAKKSNAIHTGDATGENVLTVKGINGTLLSGLATGILKNTTSTGVPVIAQVRTDYAEPTTALETGILKNTTSSGAHTIAVASDFPILNQDTTGTANNATNLAGQPASYYAPIYSPRLLGAPTAITPAPGSDSSQIATLGYVTIIDSDNVKKTGSQTISGHKTFNNFVMLDYGTLFLKRPDNSAYNMLTAIEDGMLLSPNSNGNFKTEISSHGIKFGRSSVQAELNTDNLTASRTFLVPNKSGTLALKDDFIVTSPGNTVNPAFIIPNGQLTTTPQNGAIERDSSGILWETHAGVRDKISVPDVPYKSITNLNTLFTGYRRSSVNTCQVHTESAFCPETGTSATWGILTSCKTDDTEDYGIQTYVSMGAVPNTYVRNCKNGIWTTWTKLS
ncbi:hypothetical protein SGQ83_18240 [Flavobacterium sp. Fl-318]|uniref:Uncharacterized protein n=1 Tax=Flavobacterium cupriresistens TaxID=2893885 RepID=A0ABU4RFC5_9FLAO|nr:MULTISPECIES: hypothetical protein [unclassified Flavobacterium]MDX6191300.1 hypothetical protein [Flavobacterium sp. Fl-318]UFH42382.1 hypothetical protein LNP23_21565 [Flavobacterium sp. F-323]